MKLFKPGDRVRVTQLGRSFVATVVRDDGGEWIRVAEGNTIHRARRKNVRPLERPKASPGRVTRTPKRGPVELHAVPKDQPVRSEAYLAWIRSKPCANCPAPAPSEAAHFGDVGKAGGTGTKASDLFTVPLCHECHRGNGQHQKGALPGMTPEETRRWIVRWQRDLLAEWIELRGAA